MPPPNASPRGGTWTEQPTAQVREPQALLDQAAVQSRVLYMFPLNAREATFTYARDLKGRFGGGEFDEILVQKPTHIPGSRSVLADLEAVYVIEDRYAVAGFLAENWLGSLLLEAQGPLDSSFGAAAMKTLRLVRDDEGLTTLFCLVMVPGNMEEARGALRIFDQLWWIDRCGRTVGKLNFDIELV